MGKKRASSSGYLLALDLGVQSIGWGILGLGKQNRITTIHDIGIRCFDSGVGSEKEIEMGTDESGNAQRRDARQQRRQLWRRSQRQRKVFRTLQKAGLLPDRPAREPQERHEMLLQLDAELAAQFREEGDRVGGHVLPYYLRTLALDKPLPPITLGRALYHLAQRRGFLSNKKARKDDKEEGVVKESIADLYKEMERAGLRTIGEYLGSLDPEEQRIRGRWTARAMFIEEFEAIWEAQSPHHKSLTPKLRKELKKAIFFQRPLKSQKGLIAACDLEPNQRRGQMAELAAQRFRYLQKVNDLEIISPIDDDPVSPTPEQRAALIETLESQQEVTFGKIRKLFGLKKPKGAKSNYVFNLEAGGEKKLFGNKTAARLKSILADKWDAMPEPGRQRLVHEILGFENEEALARRLAKAWKFDPRTAAAVAALNFEQGYCSYSLRAISKLLPQLEAGVRLNTVKKDVYGERALDQTVYDSLPPVVDAVKTLRNPVVCRALSELRKVVNAIIRKHGKPDMVRVELARDMKRGRKAREDIFNKMRENEKRRDAAKKKILDEIGDQEPRGGDILKVVLAEECNWTCPYTGREITPQTLLGRNPQFDIEHIIPFSRSLDNSFMNKTLCYHEENRTVKGNKTPHEAYANGDADRWWEIRQRVRRFNNDPLNKKLKRFMLEELPDDFVQRQLNDTRYISRLAADYLGMLFGGRNDAGGKQRVQVSPGRITYYLRDRWGLNAILGDGNIKDRTDHRHHAVDAVVIGLCGPSVVESLTQAAVRAEELGTRLFADVDPPWDGFVDDVRKGVDKINVSYRVNRKVQGALHEGTNYSKPHDGIDKKGKKATYYYIRKPIAKMSTDEIGNIVDERVRELVEEKLKQLGGNPQKAFADVKNHPYFKTRDGRIIPIHKARTKKPMNNPLLVGKGPGKRYVAPGANHHMEIVALLDDDGNEKKWEGTIVTLFEAAQRVHDGQPVYQREYGEGKRFKFSLTGGEFVIMEHQAGEPKLYRVASISAKVLEFRLHTDARPTTVVRKIPNARVTRSPSALLKAKARKVAVDPLGNILPAND